MDQDLIKKDYDELAPMHTQLGKNLIAALEDFLKDNKISYHTITSRTKEKKSYLDKIERKGYTDHKKQIEDLCGLRIICYYPEDLDKIGNIINQEFEVIESINKSNLLEPDKFGYRSDHYIVKIKDEWATAPNYRKLKGLKAEIQVRTILMHAWADIEHKLAYKSKEQIPPQFRRQLYQLSALLEIADNQFQNLKIEREQLKDSLVIENSLKQRVFDGSQELNLDTFQALLDFYFPDRIKKTDEASVLLENLRPLQIQLKHINEYVQKFKSTNIDPEKVLNLKPGYLYQTGIMRFILDIYNDQHLKLRENKSMASKNWIDTIIAIREQIRKVNNL